ncbi:MAG TPA: mersacidin/lichenicidin family type 2 lantibiotic [Ktedonobacteraceae bacterium]|nr:mersacidin/lichenicidin family type 2 lantibiotic [Ktedonobacteraceae bacterium]
MNIIPTWKNAAYRQSLTAGAQARLSVNPIGEVELTDADLEAVHGGSGCGGDSGLLNDNNSHNNNHNLNVLSGKDILDNNNILNGAVSNIGILGIGSSNSGDGGSGRRSGGCR